MKQVWKVPEKEEQDALRDRLRDLLDRKPMSASNIAREASLALVTLRGFMQQNKNLDWVSWKKLSMFIDKNSSCPAVALAKED